MSTSKDPIPPRLPGERSPFRAVSETPTSHVSSTDLRLYPTVNRGILEPAVVENEEVTGISDQALLQAVNASRIEGILIGVGVSMGAYILYRFIAA